MNFLSPYLLYGLLLASAPIIIHLLNRRRFIRVEWAPMEYLKLTLKTNRRRIRLEHLLLLAVRTAAVLLLFFAVARPVLSGNGLAGLLSSQGRTTRVIVIDDSLSMGLQSGGRSSLSRAREAVSELLGRIGPNDELTVLTVTEPDVPLVRQTAVDDLQTVKSLVETVNVAHSAGRWGVVFAQVEQQLDASTFPLKEVILVTDLRAEGWDSDVTEFADRWQMDEVSVRLIDVGAAASGNVVLESLVQDEPIALINSRISLTAVIRNDGGETVVAQQATLNVDGVPRSVSLPEIPAGERVAIPLTVTFDSSGWHHLELQLPSDALPEDNVRFAAVDVRSAFHLQLVDGEPDSRPFEGETDFLALALSVGSAPWQVMQSTDSEWLGNPLVPGDILILANVAALQEQRARELQSLVDAGLGLVIFPGEQLDPNSYNDVLYRDGAGLLPARITGIRDEESTGLVVEQFADSPLSALLRVSPESLARIKPRRVVDISLPTEKNEQVRILARWNDPRQSPAVIEKRVGRGRVLFWTITADRKWSDWPTEPSYLLAMRQMAMLVSSRPAVRNNFTAGESLRVPVDKEATPAGAVLTIPGQEEPLPLAVDSRAADGLQFRHDKTRRAGVYQVKWQDSLLGEVSQFFAASPDHRESNLAPLPPAQLERLFGRLKMSLVKFGGESLEISSSASELWRSAVIGLLALVVMESTLAAWVGRER